MRNVLITGSSHGIGAAAAIAFAKEEGANIGITCNKNPEGAEDTARKCEAFGVKTKIYAGDVGKHDHCKAMVEDFVKTFGQIDVLVNNAGGALQIPGGATGEFKDMPMDYWDSQIALNLNAAAYCSRYAIADMVAKGVKGRIVNISSVHSRVSWVHRRMLPYCAAKGGLNMFTRALAIEVAKYGITVNAIAPGFIFTKLSDRYSAHDLAGFRHKIPVGHGGTVDDITPMILFLSDLEKAKFIVGETVFIDGGQSIDGTIESIEYDLPNE